MATENITKEDLQKFKIELLNDIKGLLNLPEPASQWLKSSQVKKLLNISTNTLQNLRITGAIAFSKLGSSYRYKLQDIQKLPESQGNA